MYILTSKELGQPSRQSSFTFPKEVQDALDSVRNDPRSFEPLLLSTWFHPDPLNNISKYWAYIHGVTLSYSPAGKFDVVLGEVIRWLHEIFKQHNAQDPEFAQRVNNEKQLWYQLYNATRALAPHILEPFVLNAWLSSGSDLISVGSNFAGKMLPPTLRPGTIKSQIPEAHFFSLAQHLGKLAEELLKKDATFKSKAVTELRKRMLAAAYRQLTGSKSKDLKPFLIRAALSSESDQEKLGLSFAETWIKKSSNSLVYYERSVNSGSEVAAHIFVQLGIYLRVYAKDLRRENAPFNRLVKQEMKRRQSKPK